MVVFLFLKAYVLMQRLSLKITVAFIVNSSMAFRHGQNYQTLHIYNKIQHIDIEPYKYTLKLQIYISNRIHTIRNYLYVHACMYTEPRIYTSKFLHSYINLNTHIIEITHICIEPYKHTSKLHLYKWYHTSKSKCICTR